MTIETDHLATISNRYARLVREVEALVESAELDPEGRASVPIGRVNRLVRELHGEAQASTSWMSVS